MRTRRRKTSKCLPTSPYAVEKTPFKDTPENGINFDSCFNPKPAHILMGPAIRKLKDNNQEHILKNILEMDVGIDCRSLKNEVMERETNYQYFFIELQKLLKNNRRLDIYIRLSFEQENLSGPHEGVFPRKVVFQILHFIITHVVPLSLLGSNQNFKLFLKMVRKVVYGSHHQRFSLSSMVLGFKVSQVPWLQQSLPSNSLRLHVLACLVKWLLLYAQNIIHKIWHLASLSSKDIVFYDKAQWQRRTQEEIDAAVHRRIIKKCTAQNLQNEVLHVGCTRYVIKPNGLRPITIFEKPSDEASIALRQNARMLVTQLAHFNGSTNTFLSPRIDIQLQNGMLKIVTKYPLPNTRPPYYFVRVDVKDAYGSINQVKLLHTMNDVFQKVMQNIRMSNVRLGRKTCVMFESPKLVLPSTIMKGSIIKVSNEGLGSVIQHIKNYVERLGTTLEGQVYRICHGIPQGMHLSASLCEMYYSALDLEHLREFLETGDDEVFIRYCDDYLFITPHKERAEKFLVATKFAFPEKYIRFNSEKTSTNLYSDISTVAFCGYFIDINTFHIQSNFLSYENTNIVNSFNLSKFQKPGSLIHYRMRFILKLHPVLLDKRINSMSVAFTNIYKASLLLAYRFYAYVNCYIPAGKLNQTFILKCIKKGLGALRNRAIKGIKKSSADEWIPRDEIKFLVLKAFMARIIKGGGAHQYPKILRYLKLTCERVSKQIKHVRLKLLEATCKPPLPDIFKTMKWYKFIWCILTICEVSIPNSEKFHESHFHV